MEWLRGTWEDDLMAAMLPWGQVLVQLAVALGVAMLAHGLGLRLLRRMAEPHLLLRTVLRLMTRPSRWLVFAFTAHLVLQGSPEVLQGIAALRQVAVLLLILAVTWMAAAGVRGIADVVIALHPDDVEDNLNARRVRTQTNVLARAVMVLLAVLGVSAALMTFPGVRQFGASLLASAGLAGLVMGFAAKPVLGNLLAGLQIAITQPIRLDDVVIVEGEWGRIEEIAGSYVVVRIWDERRLIVPLQWFIEHPFQNWTRTGSQILGTVFLWVDYRLPLEPLRAQARHLCETAPEWDGRLALVQVTDCNERAMRLRVLVSAADASRAWDLRCRVREGLIDYLQREHPHCLPQLRVSASGEPGGQPWQPGSAEPG